MFIYLFFFLVQRSGPSSHRILAPYQISDEGRERPLSYIYDRSEWWQQQSSYHADPGCEDVHTSGTSQCWSILRKTPARWSCPPRNAGEKPCLTNAAYLPSLIKLSTNSLIVTCPLIINHQISPEYIERKMSQSIYNRNGLILKSRFMPKGWGVFSSAFPSFQ